MTLTEAIDILHDGGELLHKFYTREDRWILCDKDSKEHGLSKRAANALMKSVVLTKNYFGGITVHTYKINPKLKEK